MPRSATRPALEPLSRLPRAPASDVKRLGWRRIMSAVCRDGALLITRHRRPEAVIMPVAEYLELMLAVGPSESKKRVARQDLRKRFDEQLAVLNEPSASARLRSAMSGPVRLRGKLKVSGK